MLIRSIVASSTSSSYCTYSRCWTSRRPIRSVRGYCYDYCWSSINNSTNERIGGGGGGGTLSLQQQKHHDRRYQTFSFSSLVPKHDSDDDDNNNNNNNNDDDNEVSVRKDSYNNNNKNNNPNDGTGDTLPSTSTTAAATTTPVLHNLTFSRQKAGTPSPWAVFDAWGAGAMDNVVPPPPTSSSLSSSSSSSLVSDHHLHHHLNTSDTEARLLTNEAVRIPMTTMGNNNNNDGSNILLTPPPLHSPYGEKDILDAYESYLQQRSAVHFGYPYNLMYDHRELSRFMKYSINNLGDPFVPSNYGVHSRQFECAVIDFFAQLWEMDDDNGIAAVHNKDTNNNSENNKPYWGYVTTSGTEGNLHGILLARECHPDGILYTSNETHYSVFKAARYYRMDLRSIPTLPMGEINYELLAQELDANRHYPAIINVNIGTTVKGAVDNLDKILSILTELQIPRERYHIHCDGALFALMMPFIDDAPTISFRTKPIDSIAVSGHKMLGCPMPCGVALCRREHVDKVEQHIDYLNSVDTTIMGSRNGQAALYMWYSLRKKGLSGIKADVLQCMETAKYLRDKLSHVGLSCRLNELSSTVVLERPMEDSFIKRWQLACEEDIAHVVVMPNVTTHKIDVFVQELTQSVERYGRTEPLHPNSSLTKLRNNLWTE